MRLAPGSTLGPYQIVAALGAGGMGEVYKARDSRLNRSVAIKILPPLTADDPDAIARFNREAEAIAALRHPNICVLHDVGRHEGIQYLVMEYLDGETLESCLRRGALPIHDALRIGREIALGLAAAHHAGIVHRDLKPGNVMLTASGARLVDFGLAKPRVASTTAPTPITTQMALTTPGTFVGSVPYMAPEQIQGQPVDARTDLFALGVVLYEMTTGRRPFTGDTPAAIIAATLERDPPPPSQIASVPPLFERLIVRCLAKKPEQRWESAHDLADALGWIDERMAEPERQSWRKHAYLGWLTAALMTAALVVGLATRARESTSTAPPLRLQVVAPPGTSFTPVDLRGAPQFALSPDGGRIAFVAAEAGRPPRLWVRALDVAAAQPLAGTEEATNPFWSPDGGSLAFFARGRLKRVRLAGGPPQELATVANDVNGGTWGPDGTILFGGAAGDPLFRVSAEGGVVVPGTTLDATRMDRGHLWPQFLPDGKRYLLYVRSALPNQSGVYLGTLRSASTQLVRAGLTNAVYAPSGHLLFEQTGTLSRQAFDTSAGRLTGEAAELSDEVTQLVGSSQLPVSASADRLAYWSGELPPTQPVWIERIGTPGASIAPPGGYMGMELSPDGSRVLLLHGRGRELVSLALATQVVTRMTFAPGIGHWGVWSPDGTSVLYADRQTSGYRLLRKPSSGAGQEHTVLTADNVLAVFPTDWSADVILYQTTAGGTGWDIWRVNPEGGGARPVIADAFHQVQARLSPDTRWIAYASNESGRWEVCVQSFPGGGAKLQVSTDGGREPEWRADGRELFYMGLDNTLVAVPVRSGPTFDTGRPERLFATRVHMMLAPHVRNNYAVSRDGHRFLVNNIVFDAPPQVITILDRWRAGVKQ